MARRIFVLRHGQTQFNAEQKLQGHCNSPLTDKGIHQAQRVGAKLNTYLTKHAYRVYASPLGRAMQTAHIVCEALGCDGANVIEEPRLKEFSLGAWEQCTIPSLQAQYPQLLADNDWYLRAPQAESYDAVKTRVQAWLDELPATNEDIVVVSHALTGIVLRGLLAGLDYAAVWQQDLPQDAFFVIEQGTITRVDCRDD